VSAHCRRPGGTHRARHSGAVRVAMITPVAALAVASGVTVRVEARREALPPDGPQVVAQAALLAPVRVSRAMAARAGGGSVAPAVLRSRNGAPDYSAIPGVALAAYQRAELIMRSADKSCRLDWSLLAAIGYVESDHGRDGGSRLDAAGVARPGIQGDRRKGTRGAVAIRDTDSGLFDHDRRFDRAVGPMHFVPSTWLVVGVDADGDSKRDPQDIDDAALAAAVLLCSASDDLSGHLGQRQAVYRYWHPKSYVVLVLAVAKSYARSLAADLLSGTPIAVRVTAPALTLPHQPVELPGSDHPDVQEDDGVKPTKSPDSTVTSPTASSPTGSHTSSSPTSSATSSTPTGSPTASPPATSPTASPPAISPTSSSPATSPTAS